MAALHGLPDPTKNCSNGNVDHIWVVRLRFRIDVIVQDDFDVENALLDVYVFGDLLVQRHVGGSGVVKDIELLQLGSHLLAVRRLNKGGPKIVKKCKSC